MAEYRDTRPVGQLFTGLVNDVTGLFRKEIELAKAEANEKLSNVLSGVEVLIFGAVLAVGAVGVLLAAVVTGVATLFVIQGIDPTMANAFAGVIVGVVIGLIAWALIVKGLNALHASNLKFKKTASSLERDAEIVKERL